MKKQIITLPLLACDQLDDIFTKLLARASFDRLSFKPSMFDLYVLVWGEVLLHLVYLIIYISVLVKVFCNHAILI